MNAEQKALFRFYLYGRDDAEDDFDLEDFDMAALGRKVLEERAELHEVVKAAVTAHLAMSNFDGSIGEFIDDYEDELEECHGDDEVTESSASVHFDTWRQGFMDEAMLQLETEVVDQIDEMLEDDDEAPRRRPPKTKKNGGKKNPGITYYGFAQDGRKDAVNSWDDRHQELVDSVVAKARARGGPLSETDVGNLAAEVVEAEIDEDKEQWIEHNAEDAAADGIDVERAYDSYWWPSYKHKIAQMVAERAVDKLAEPDED